MEIKTKIFVGVFVFLTFHLEYSGTASINTTTVQSSETTTTLPDFSGLWSVVASMERRLIANEKEIADLKNRMPVASEKTTPLSSSITDGTNTTTSTNFLNGKNFPSFFAQRKTNFKSEKKFITFDHGTLNTGNHFNLSTGFFTAPLKGVYFFFFSCVKMKAEHHGDTRFLSSVGDHAKMTVSIERIDSNKTQTAIAKGHINSYDWYSWHQLTVQATITLEENDRVGAFLYEGFLFNTNDGGENYASENPGLTSFTGFLLH